MAKKIEGYIKLQVPAGQANPSPPIGPALGQRGVNIPEFCKQFNAATQKLEPGSPIPTVITVYSDRSFTFEMRTPPASYLLKKAAKIDKGSGEPNKNKVGKVTKKQVREIAEQKLPDLNTTSIESAMRSVAGKQSDDGAGSVRPDFVLGDRDGTTCEPRFTELVRETLASMGYQVSVNDPYKGVELVRAYSDPAAGRHSLQIEINKRLYMDESTLEKSPGFRRLQKDLGELLRGQAAVARAVARSGAKDGVRSPHLAAEPCRCFAKACHAALRSACAASHASRSATRQKRIRPR